jgi:hypothetical protein
MNTSEEPVDLAGATLGEHRHSCAFFHNVDEEYRVLLPFIKEGLQHGEKAYIVDPDLSAEHRRQLDTAGIDVSAAEHRGQAGHAEWAGENWPGIDDFLEYECRLNEIPPRHRDCVVCLYDLSKTRGDLIMDAMRTHPLVVLGGVLQVNPFFVPPDQFLRALRKRRSAGSEPASLG